MLSRSSLIRSFAINDLKLRYKNSFLGFFWSVLEPLLLFVVLYIVFTQIFPNSIPNFGLYLFSSLIVWNGFARATSLGANSIIGRAGIVTKIYFPREILPLSACITSFLMMVFEFGVFFVFVVYLQFVPPITIIFLIPLLVMVFILGLGFALPLSVLNVYYRDVQYIWNVLLQAGFYLTPSFYTWDSVSNIKDILAINPMAQIIDMTHDVTLYNKIPNQSDVLYTIGMTIVILAVGYLVFYKYEKRVAEEV